MTPSDQKPGTLSLVPNTGEAPKPRPVPPPPDFSAPKPKEEKAPAAQPQAQPAATGVAPPVSPAYRRLRHSLVMLSFVLCVLLPAGGTGYYLWEIAADQYASRMGFSVRREENSSALEMLSGLSKLSGSSSNDTDILYEYVQSQRLVRDLDSEIDLRAIWSKPSQDVIFALPEDASIEELVEYWNSMVRLSFGTGSGLLDIEVRAFSADDAHLIAQKLFERSSDLVNELSSVAREDSISYAREDLDTALERLKEARETVTRFRNENQIINPEIDLQSQAGLLGNLQAQQAEAIIEIDLLSESVRDGDPRLEQAQRRLQVIETRIAAEREKLGVRSTDPANGERAMADIVGEYERLVVDREFAERAYLSALGAYDAALAESRRKSRYLAAYLEPTLAETPKYPQRTTLLFLVSLFLFLGWSIGVMIYYSVKDRR
ncbi:hypothetical protein VK792_15435 [Mesobacterium sp. TK19101]|uniref:Uncharacterized protein n=1 Tax=Mesobacterium hydrothermale TaxID=3111907 RepID=A0ABU6HJP8_9RHOB|nr:hypothetical protein [Mesobacterium sp. TK19101]MEC3862683.1 hypothetical protein [Mesobacterium sp. TK19101]